ncbi:5'-nucleotidase C-terminal domain-containing protein [Anaerostipes sp.]|uniref:5'-nucleotidase C-terminal domain-containing protein n=1 Tax=Anaerostipes sp. TaxID=1872530 RepID=UPI0025B7C2B9|nr:5'-nucleotidase C-terminal domain-containing protein [Anaerostipes sp.]MBS7007270.1 extracellular solute-binding protein [Anaerostipes sp.]
MKRNAAWKIAGILITVLILMTLAGCSRKQPKEKTVIKILYANNFKQVEALVESTYDDIDLQVELSLYSSEQLRRLERGGGPDLVIAPQPDSNLVRKYLMDISDTKASSAYDGTIMSASKLDGKTYLIPLPGVYGGYVVNETLFKQAGLSMPANNKELVAALSTLKKKGLGVGEDNINFSIMNDYNTSIGMFLVGDMVPDFLGTVEGVKWLADFKNRKATFSGVWEQSFTLTDALVEAGVMDPQEIALQRNSVLCQQRLSNGTLAAAFGDSALYYECIAKNQEAVKEGTSKAYTYRMLPFLSDKGNKPWFLFSPSALMGINKSISKEKKDACKRVLDLLSTSKGQDALIKDLGAGMSCLTDYQQKDDLIPRGAEKYVKSGYVYNVLFPGKTVEYLGGNVRNIMAGKCTVKEAMQAIDQFHYGGSDKLSYDFTEIGKMKHDLLFEDFNVRRGETELGNFIADCVAEASDAPIAVVNGGGIRASFYQGVVYGGDVDVVCPFDNRIIVLEMDGQTLWDMLENGVSTCTDEFPSGRFLQVSKGMNYTFDSSKPAGSRIVSVTMSDGSALKLDERYKVAVTDYMAGSKTYAEGNGDGYTMLNIYDKSTPKGNVKMVKETGLFYRDALAQYFEQHRNTAVDAKQEGRIRDLAQNK